jgi:circadian clock protein KaiC
MTTRTVSKRAAQRAPTGIDGFDAITRGGLPAGRVSVVLGGAGTGKTIFALQTLVEGARRWKERGVFVAFEERSQHILSDMTEFQWEVFALPGKWIDFIDAKLPEPVLRGGEFDLLGLLAALGATVKRLGAQRVVLDGLDVLLDSLGDAQLIRRELFRLRDWLLDSGLTAIFTAKSELGTPRLATGYAVLQFLADCVVCLDHRLVDSTAIRTIRVEKLRGVAHSANEFPFAIARTGIEIASGAAREIDHRIFTDKVGTGVTRLDAMLGGGYFRGSSILISGVPGTAKTTLAAAFADAACLRNERVLYVSFDEAPQQILRNLESVGLRLQRHVKRGLLRLCGLRTRSADAESHLSMIRGILREHRPQSLVIDPLSAFAHLGETSMAEAAAVHVIDAAKCEGITALSTTLVDNVNPLAESTSIAVSTVSDTWIHLSYVNQRGERNRALTIIKSRGMSHSNQVRELVLSDAGLTLTDVYMAGGEVLMGTLRWEKEQEQRRAQKLRRLENERRRREAELVLAEATAKAETLEHQRALRQMDLDRVVAERKSAEAEELEGRDELGVLRKADAASAPPAGSGQSRTARHRRRR